MALDSGEKNTLHPKTSQDIRSTSADVGNAISKQDFWVNIVNLDFAKITTKSVFHSVF